MLKNFERIFLKKVLNVEDITYNNVRHKNLFLNFHKKNQFLEFFFVWQKVIEAKKLVHTYSLMFVVLKSLILILLKDFYYWAIPQYFGHKKVKKNPCHL